MSDTANAITQYVRCFIDSTKHQNTVPKVAAKPARTKRSPTKEGEAIRAIGAPYGEWCLVIHSETTADAAQQLRIGTYAVYGLDREERQRRYRAGMLDREGLDTFQTAGIFYNPTVLSDDEIVLVRDYCLDYGLECLPVDTFIDRVFYKWAYRYRALVIGHNLAFDLGGLTTGFSNASGAYRGGFRLSLCQCKHKMDCWRHPAVRIKHIGRYKDKVAFAHFRKQDGKVEGYDGRFLDIVTLALALIGAKDVSLPGLCELLEISGEHGKMETPAHGATLTAEHLQYACRNAEAIWKVYQRLRDVYRQHGLSTDMWRIYSEASLAKAYLKEICVPRFMEQHPSFPKERLGQTMTGYYGGISEVQIRLQPTEVLYCDFKSQYPTVNALMGLQELLLAEQIDVRGCTADVQAWLTTFTIDELQNPDTWKRLRVFVKVRPENDLLPVRTEHGMEGLNTSLSDLTGPPMWYTLADVIASILLTKKVPEILEAFELVPFGKVQTQPIALFGDRARTLDLSEHDLFTAIVDLRDRVKAERDRLDPSEPQYSYLDHLQWALKVLANSGSYGVLVEVNQEEPTENSKEVDIYGLSHIAGHTKVVEKPGTYFAGPIGVLIPAGGRLLLALAQRLAADRGIEYALCDTDSLAFARPARMSRPDFHQHVEDVRSWFTPLSPYDGKPPILRLEDVNAWNREPEPLYAIGISAKRYVLYNRLDEGVYRIRKFSSHGTGTWGELTGYESPSDIPEPCNDVYELGGYRWLYDMWYMAIDDIEQGELPYHVPSSPVLQMPARHTVSCSTADILESNKNIEGMRPYAFFDVLPPLGTVELLRRQSQGEREECYPLATNPKFRVLPNGDRVDAHSHLGRYRVYIYEGLKGISYYAPFQSKDVRRTDTHERVQIKHKTIAECLANYFTHFEWRAAKPDMQGELSRKHLQVIGVQLIGKETNPLEIALWEESGGTLNEERTQLYANEVSPLVDILARCSIEDLATSSGISARTLRNIRDGAKPRRKTVDKLVKSLGTVQQNCCIQCNESISGKKGRQYCSDVCKKAAYRSRKIVQDHSAL